MNDKELTVRSAASRLFSARRAQRAHHHASLVCLLGSLYACATHHDPIAANDVAASAKPDAQTPSGNAPAVQPHEDAGIAPSRGSTGIAATPTKNPSASDSGLMIVDAGDDKAAAAHDPTSNAGDGGDLRVDAGFDQTSSTSAGSGSNFALDAGASTAAAAGTSGSTAGGAAGSSPGRITASGTALAGEQNRPCSTDADCTTTLYSPRCDPTELRCSHCLDGDAETNLLLRVSVCLTLPQVIACEFEVNCVAMNCDISCR